MQSQVDPFQSPLQDPPPPFMEKSGPSNMLSHLNLTFYLILYFYLYSIHIRKKCSCHSASAPSVSMTRNFLCIFLSVLSFPFLSLSQIVPSLFPHHGALLRGLINHSGRLSVTPSLHTAVVPAAHTCTHTLSYAQ